MKEIRREGGEQVTTTLSGACPECGHRETVEVAPVGCDSPRIRVCETCWPRRAVPTYRFTRQSAVGVPA